jgi:hypothetical protein
MFSGKSLFLNQPGDRDSKIPWNIRHVLKTGIFITTSLRMSTSEKQKVEDTHTFRLRGQFGCRCYQQLKTLSSLKHLMDIPAHLVFRQRSGRRIGERSSLRLTGFFVSEFTVGQAKLSWLSLANHLSFRSLTFLVPRTFISLDIWILMLNFKLETAVNFNLSNKKLTARWNQRDTDV